MTLVNAAAVALSTDDHDVY